LVEVPFGADFESHPAVTWIKFKHDENVSKYFLQLFDEGRSLFPDDPISRVANKIQNAQRIDEKRIDNIISQWHGIEGGVEDIKGLKSSIKKIIDFGVYEKGFMEKENLESIKLQWEAKAAEFGTKCTTIPVSLVIHPPSNDKNE
jgi:hypothetical protein